MNQALNNWLDEAEGLAPETTNDAINKERKAQGMPEFGKQYALTGATGAPCIANGNTLAESEVKKEVLYPCLLCEKMTPEPACKECDEFVKTL